MAPRKGSPTYGLPRTGGRASPVDYTDTDEDVGSLGDIAPILQTGKYLTPVAVAEMARQIRLGVPVPTAATAVGAGSRAKHWAEKARIARARGEQPGWEEGECPELAWLEACEAAKAQFESDMVAHIAAAAPHDWKAALALLERRASRRWHAQTKLTVEAKDSGKLEITAMSTSKLLSIARGLVPEDAIKETLSLPSGDATDAEIVDDDIRQQDD